MSVVTVSKSSSHPQHVVCGVNEKVQDCDGIKHNASAEIDFLTDLKLYLPPDGRNVGCAVALVQAAATYDSIHDAVC